jgi:hypothetical protein
VTFFLSRAFDRSFSPHTTAKARNSHFSSCYALVSGKRPDTVQNALDAIGVAAVFEYSEQPEKQMTPPVCTVAKRLGLGMGRQKLGSCQERAQKILQGSKDGERALFEPVVKKTRRDCVRDLAAKVVFDWSHSEENRTKIVRKGIRPVKIKNPHTEEEERHLGRRCNIGRAISRLTQVKRLGKIQGGTSRQEVWQEYFHRVRVYMYKGCKKAATT